MSLAVAAALASGAAVAYGMATALQAHEARRLSVGTGSVDGSRPPGHGLGRLATRRLWLLGLAADLLGATVHVLALGNGPASLVQPVQVAGLALALFVGRALTRAHGATSVGLLPSPREAWGLLALAAGLALFFAAVRPHAALRELGAASGLTLGATGVLTMALACLAARGRSATTRARLLGGAAGVAFGLTAVMVDGLSRDRQLYGWGHLVGVRPLALAVLTATVAVGGLCVSQAAFAAGKLVESLPLLTVLDPLVAVAVGGWVLGESGSGGCWSRVFAAMAAAIVTVGVCLLARTGSTAPVARARGRRAWKREPPWSALGIGALYGLLPATLAVVVDVHADADDGPTARVLLILLAVGSASVISGANAIRHRPHPRHR